MPQFNIPYNNWEDGQVAFSGQVLANFNAILSALNNGIGSDNIADNTVTDAKIGLRTIADTGTPADAALLSAHLNGLANRIKAITGESNWKTDPVKSLRVIDTAVNNAVAFSNTALSNSSTALSTANAANATAALAETKADAAVVTANTASSNASTALNKATQVEIDYTAMVPVLNQAVSDAEAAVVAVADKVSTEQMENYVDQVLGDVILGSVGQMEILGSYTAVGGETSFVISSTQYNTSLDRLHLSYDGLDLYEGINYTRSGTTINLWEMEAGQVVHYQIRKNVFMDNTLSDGSLLINGSVNEAKLSVDVQNKLNAEVVVPVASVAGKTGDVVLDASDIGVVSTRLNNGQLEYYDGSGWKTLSAVKSVQSGYTGTAYGPEDSGTGEDSYYRDIIISSVDLNKSMVLINGVAGSLSDVRLSARLVNNTTLRISARSHMSPSQSLQVRWQVVEYN